MKTLIGQVRAECLTCTFRASCCSARLSRALEKKDGGGGGGGVAPALTGTREYKQSDRGWWFRVLRNFEGYVRISMKEIRMVCQNK